MREILQQAKSIAVVGLSPDPEKISHQVASYLQRRGLKIYPVYPKPGEILGQKVYQSISEISDKIDIVVMFRKAEFASDLVREVAKCGVKTLWLQLGIINDEAAQFAAQNGINFIQDRCIKIEYEGL